MFLYLSSKSFSFKSHTGTTNPMTPVHVMDLGHRLATISVPKWIRSTKLVSKYNEHEISPDLTSPRDIKMEATT